MKEGKLKSKTDETNIKGCPTCGREDIYQIMMAEVASLGHFKVKKNKKTFEAYSDSGRPFVINYPEDTHMYHRCSSCGTCFNHEGKII